LEPLIALGRFGLFSAAVLWRIVTPRWEVQETLRQTWGVSIRCLLPVAATVFPFGMVMSLQGLEIFDLFGAQRLLSSLVSVAVFRELSPVMATALVAAQGGSSFAAELGAMRIKEEIDATTVMAIDPLRVHVVPRVIAALVATPVLGLIGSASGIAGGYVTAVWLKGEPSGTWWANLWALTELSDVLGGAVKCLVFGAIIGFVSCYNGYNASGGAAGVGRAVNDTVVTATTSAVVANYFLTTVLFGSVG
jgi:phospholipid/cholesterol/gamma-HCH transport system permease protein